MAQTQYCSACGKPVREGAQFCPICGAEQRPRAEEPPADSHAETAPPKVTEASPPEPDASEARPMPAAPSPPQARPVSQVSQAPSHVEDLRTRTANFWRDPRTIKWAIGSEVAIIAGIVVAFVLLGGDDSKDSTPAAVATTTTVSAIATQEDTTTTSDTASSQDLSTSTPSSEPQQDPNSPAALKAGVQDIDAVLVLAAEGRQDLANDDMTSAIANREAVLSQLSKLELPPDLEASSQALREAMMYSLNADRSCGFSCPDATNDKATALKEKFISIYNPIAVKYGAPTYSSGDF